MIAIISDSHIPYQSEYGISSLLSKLRKLSPKRILLLGDILDCYPFMRYRKDPEKLLSVNIEIDQARKFLGNIRKIVKNGDITYLEGNHEERLNKFIWDHAPQLSPLEINIPTILKLEDEGIEYINNKDGILINNIRFLHGNFVRKNPGMSALAHMERTNTSIVIGHCHRLSLVYMNYGDIRFGMETGCLADPSKCEYTIFPNWMLGFGIINDDNQPQIIQL